MIKFKWFLVLFADFAGRPEGQRIDGHLRVCAQRRGKDRSVHHPEIFLPLEREVVVDAAALVVLVHLAPAHNVDCEDRRALRFSEVDLPDFVEGVAGLNLQWRVAHDVNRRCAGSEMNSGHHHQALLHWLHVGLGDLVVQLRIAVVVQFDRAIFLLVVKSSRMMSIGDGAGRIVIAHDAMQLVAVLERRGGGEDRERKSRFQSGSRSGRGQTLASTYCRARHTQAGSFPGTSRW